MTDLRKQVNGTFTRAELERMTWPVAWSGTMPRDEGKRQEDDLHDMVRRAVAAIEEYELYSESEAVAVIKDGELVEIDVTDAD